MKRERFFGKEPQRSADAAGGFSEGKILTESPQNDNDYVSEWRKIRI